ncbi:PREDICTED: cyclin-B2-2-like isoform X2 [Camelina sativa]|uniref:Cyclin-B2-2-like isoform X2 n=1 Tax=Camelina sativa TaxID=90675 RepID=A0ABM0YZ69_CAMSA|nr:PREDICTED: cyclin-B2-2-like isoform X2 [Camelina sativa]
MENDESPSPNRGLYNCLCHDDDDDTRSRKVGIEMKRQNRRGALSVINQNLVGSKAYPCVVNKRRDLKKRQRSLRSWRRS